MPASDKIQRLVEVFERNLPAYKNSGYKEAQLRSEFIEPFFEELGWDVRNKQGWAEAYKDVITEDAIKVGGYTKAPDYCFRIGGTRKFFLEAKKPSVDIRGDVSPAYQLRRYAWSADLPLSILTDFEEFAVYNCRVRPQLKDKPGQDRVMFIPYREYAERWDEIAAVFSRKAVLEGLFDKYAESVVGRRTTQEVDDEFLKEIEGWRDLLARNIALRNPSLSIRELNYAVQKTIDRIIFLRICEDRGAERYGQLQALLNGPRIYRRLTEIFQQADEKYNSGLFHFREEKGMVSPPDTLTTALMIDDQVLKEILKNLYYPDSPYEFSVLGSEILGNIYEQFLGKVIRLTAGHHAVVEEKPEVRKAGGVYYTPTYIVDYIVKNTVGKLCEGKTPKQIEKLKILDPACGSGSFLIGAYTYLLNYHRDWYVKHLLPERGFEGAIAKAALRKLVPGEKPEMPIYQGRGGQWYLSTREKKRILLNNIFGVDIDSQAVEVTKLSLLLKVLENENQDTLDRQMKLWRERALPDLGNNIKCGNSLIGPDIYEAGSLRAERSNPISFTPEDRERINAFDWKAEYPEIMRSGGFDVVIGNPPYVRQEALSDFKRYFETNYEAYDGVADLYTYFMEQGVKLLRDGGFFSIIVSSSFLRASYGESLRRTLKKHAAVLRIVDFGGLAIFVNAKDTYVCIPLLQKGGKQARIEVAKVNNLDFTNLADHVRQHHFSIPSERLSAEAWALKSDEEAAVLAKITRAGKPLSEYVGRRIYYGIKTGLNDAFIIDNETRKQLINQDKKSAELIKPLLGGEDIRRNIFHETGLWLIFTRRGVDINRYPAIHKHLAQWKEDLTPKRDKGVLKGRKPGRYAWYEIQDDVAYYEVFDGPKLIYPDIAKGPRFCLDVGGHYLANTAYCLGTDDLYLLGILNSRLFWYAISNISIPFGVRAGEYRYRLIYQYMEKVPIRVIDLSKPADKIAHDRMVPLVERMLDLHKRLAAAKNPDEKIRLDREIKSTDDQIDRLVYELYGLTEEEIKIVEGGKVK